MNTIVVEAAFGVVFVDKNDPVSDTNHLIVGGIQIDCPNLSSSFALFLLFNNFTTLPATQPYPSID